MRRTLTSVRVCSPVGVSRTVELRCAERHPRVPQSPAQRGAGTGRRAAAGAAGRRAAAGPLAAAQQQAPLAAAQQQAPLAAQASIQQPAPRSTSTTPTDRLQPGQVRGLASEAAGAHPARTPGAHPACTAAGGAGGDSGGQQWTELNVSRVSEKFTPKGIGDNPLLLGGGGQNAGEGMRGYGSLLKKVGLGGGGE